MITLTCKNHPKSRYLTKNLFTRSLHFIDADPDYVRSVRPALAHLSDEILSVYPVECPCSWQDLIPVEGSADV
jgi:hypothetical protein